MQKLLFLMNPNAGQRKVNRVLPEIISIFNESGYEVTVFVTTGPGSGAAIVEPRARDYDLIVCAGGDGTLNETITGVLRAGADCPIGYIPCGSTNDFAATLKLSTDVIQAAKDIVEGGEQTYDVGLFNGRYFSYVASFGAFTRVSYATPQGFKNVLGHAAYILEGIQELSQIKKLHVRLELDGDRVVEDDFLFGAVSNSTSVGGVLNLDPKQVDMSDGQFELLLVRAPKDLSEISECIRALRTQQYNCRMITFVPASQVKVMADPDMVWTLDGERAEGGEVIEVENLHQAIRLIQRG